MAYSHKWSPLSCRSSAGQGKFTGKRPAFYCCVTQPTSKLVGKTNREVWLSVLFLGVVCTAALDSVQLVLPWVPLHPSHCVPHQHLLAVSDAAVLVPQWSATCRRHYLHRWFHRELLHWQQWFVSVMWPAGVEVTAASACVYCVCSIRPTFIHADYSMVK